MNESAQHSIIKPKQIDVENCDFKKQHVINSPRSIEAMKCLGYSYEDLVYSDFIEYIYHNFDVKPLPKELQLNRYSHVESVRQKKIEEVKKLRQEIIDNPAILSEKQNQIGFSKISSYSQNSVSRISKSLDMRQHTKIEQELQALEKQKQNQEKMFMNLIQHEINLEASKKEKTDKLLLHKLREEQFQAKKLKEKFPEIRDEDMKAIIDGDENVKDKVRKQVLIRSHELEKKKNEEWKEHLDEIQNKKIQDLIERQIVIDEQEEKKKKKLEEKKEIKRQKKLEDQAKKQEKYNQALKAYEDNLLKIRVDWNIKQDRIHEKTLLFEATREKKSEERKEKLQNKLKQIQNVMLSNNELEKEKIEKFFRKKSVVERRRSLMEDLKQEEIKRKEFQRHQKHISNQANLQNSIEKYQTYQESLLEKQKNYELKIKTQMEAKEKDRMMQNEGNAINRLARYDKIKQLEKVREYERELLLKKVDEKSKQIEDFLQLKSKISEEKRAINFHSLDKKKELLHNYENIIKSHSGMLDAETQGELNQKFPNRHLYFDGNAPSAVFSHSKSKSIDLNKNMNHSQDHESDYESHKNKNMNMSDISLNKKLSQSKKDNSSKMTPEKTKQVMNSSSIQEEIKKDKEILKKLEDFRQKLNETLLEMLSNERAKEEEREKHLREVTDFDERKKLDKAYGLERAQASSNIIKFNSDIERKVKDFEKKLRNRK